MRSSRKAQNCQDLCLFPHPSIPLRIPFVFRASFGENSIGLIWSRCSWAMCNWKFIECKHWQWRSVSDFYTTRCMGHLIEAQSAWPLVTWLVFWKVTWDISWKLCCCSVHWAQVSKFLQNTTPTSSKTNSIPKQAKWLAGSYYPLGYNHVGE